MNSDKHGFGRSCRAYGAHLLMVSMFSAVPALAVDAGDWGQPVNGLRISISLDPVEGGLGDIHLAFQNIGDKNLTLYISGSSCYIFKYAKAFFKDGAGHVYTARRDEGGEAGGRRYCTVLIPPGEERSFRQPDRSFWFDGGVRQRLATLSQPGELWVEYEPPADRVMDGCTRVPCWAGKVVSNTLVLPVH